jgi:hypothetical protein
MKLKSFLITIVLVSAFSVRALSDDNFKTSAAWVLIPIVVGYFLYRERIPGISDIGWGMIYGALAVALPGIIFIIYLIATFKMTRLF